MTTTDRRTQVATRGDVPATIEGPQQIAARGPWRLAFARLRRDRVAIGALVVIAGIVALALLAPVLADLTGHGPNDQYRREGLSPAGIPVGPNAQFWLGTDGLGRDIAVRIAYGARVSLLAGVAASGLAVALGVVVGLLAGFLRGAVDALLARFMDIVLAFPFLLFAIALVSVVGPSLGVSIVVIAFFSWGAIGRVVRGQTLAIREREYVQAARSLGASNLRIMFIDVLPNLLAPVIVYTTLLIPLTIVFEATLSFLGLGIVPPTPSWGNMLAESIGYYRVAWWYVIFPGAALLATTLAFNLLGDSVRDAFTPGGLQEVPR